MDWCANNFAQCYLGKHSVNNILIPSRNISPVNNNPFEFWVSTTDPEYNKLMYDVEKFMDNPNCDTPVHSIFSDDMFDELLSLLAWQGISGLDSLRQAWRTDHRTRPCFTRFIRDKALGEKRPISMPDRITNTINLSCGAILLRPSVLNAFRGE
mmetsp:Transcript_6731/g.21055  ORF Transcript_6731/g.21055 Transcript_6731/m.21055 type:complete len:154 (-) Transcript_6731:97-558(-)